VTAQLVPGSCKIVKLDDEEGLVDEASDRGWPDDLTINRFQSPAFTELMIGHHSLVLYTATNTRMQWRIQEFEKGGHPSLSTPLTSPPLHFPPFISPPSSSLPFP